MRFEPGSYYHIYNRGVNSADTSFTKQDYAFLIEKFRYYLSLSVETYAYCLLKNHFHFLIKVLHENESDNKISVVPESDFDSYYILPNPDKRSFPAHTLVSHWMNSYSKHFNSKYNRSGPLWDGRINKKLIDSEEYLQNVICYIHRNPVHHGITDNYSDYPYSSYSACLNNSSDIISSDLVLSVFGGKDNFIAAH